jgi:hypothetical protein
MHTYTCTNLHTTMQRIVHTYALTTMQKTHNTNVTYNYIHIYTNVPQYHTIMLPSHKYIHSYIYACGSMEQYTISLHSHKYIIYNNTTQPSHISKHTSMNNYIVLILHTHTCTCMFVDTIRQSHTYYNVHMHTHALESI